MMDNPLEIHTTTQILLPTTIKKRQRRPAGTPDADAEVVVLSPKTLMEADHYICEICKRGFQREQNLQMHKRRHKIPWKPTPRTTSSSVNSEIRKARKRVYVCPQPNCLHHEASHALGDLVGIKKHYRRKHSLDKQWNCWKCSKAYAVQSDYKAHLKSCGTKGHSCDCGGVFSRVQSFMQHHDVCTMVQEKATILGGLNQPPQQANRNELHMVEELRRCNPNMYFHGFGTPGSSKKVGKDEITNTLQLSIGLCSQGSHNEICKTWWPRVYDTLANINNKKSMSSLMQSNYGVNEEQVAHQSRIGVVNMKEDGRTISGFRQNIVEVQREVEAMEDRAREEMRIALNHNMDQL